MAATVSTAPRARSAGSHQDVDHGGGEGDALGEIGPGAAVVLRAVAEHDMAAHGMSQHHDGSGGFGDDQPLQEEVQVLENSRRN